MNKREKTLDLGAQYELLDKAFRRAASRYGSEEGPALIGIREGHEPADDLQFEEYYYFGGDLDDCLRRKVTGDRDLLMGSWMRQSMPSSTGS